MSSERRLPRIIQLGNKLRSSPFKKLKAPSDPPPSTLPPKNLFQTPTKETKPTTKRIRGILKTPSHRFSGIKAISPKKNRYPSTPETAATNDSYEQDWKANNSIRSSSIRSGSTIGSVSTFGTTSTKGIEQTIEKIIHDDHIGEPSSETEISSCDDEIHRNNHASSSESVSSASTSSTICSTTSKEELQRCARIKHIEDLTERIREARARKLVERRAYRKEDRLLLRFARQLKAVCKESRENALNITIVSTTILVGSRSIASDSISYQFSFLHNCAVGRVQPIQRRMLHPNYARIARLENIQDFVARATQCRTPTQIERRSRASKQDTSGPRLGTGSAQTKPPIQLPVPL